MGEGKRETKGNKEWWGGGGGGGGGEGETTLGGLNSQPPSSKTPYLALFLPVIPTRKERVRPGGTQTKCSCGSQQWHLKI